MYAVLTCLSYVNSHIQIQLLILLWGWSGYLASSSGVLSGHNILILHGAITVQMGGPNLSSSYHRAPQTENSSESMCGGLLMEDTLSICSWQAGLGSEALPWFVSSFYSSVLVCTCMCVHACICVYMCLCICVWGGVQIPLVKPVLKHSLENPQKLTIYKF